MIFVAWKIIAPSFSKIVIYFTVVYFVQVKYRL